MANLMERADWIIIGPLLAVMLAACGASADLEGRTSGSAREDRQLVLAQGGPAAGARVESTSRSSPWMVRGIEAVATAGALVWLGFTLMSRHRSAETRQRRLCRRYAPPVFLWLLAVGGAQSWSVRSVTISGVAVPMSPPDAPDPDVAQGPFSFTISTVPVEESLISGHVRVPARVVAAPHSEVRVAAPAPGFISYPSGPLQVGRRVQKGETLVLFQHHFNLHDYVHLFNERRRVLRELIRAEREEVAARVAYERAQELAELQVVSKGEMLQHETRWREAAADARAWTRRLELHDHQIQSSDPTIRPIVAPITGIIAEIRVPQGQLVHEADSLLTLVDLSEVWVEGVTSVAEAPVFERADSAWLVLPGNMGEARKGRRRVIVPVVDDNGRMLRVYYSVPNAEALLRLNMSVDLLVDRGDRHTALTVPRSAVLSQEQKSFVFVRVAPDRYVRREVRSLSEDAHALAIEGLVRGEEVVVEGNRQLLAVVEEGEGRAPQADAELAQARSGPPSVPDHDHGPGDATSIEIPRDAQERLGIQVQVVQRQPLQPGIEVTGIIRPAPHQVAEIVAPLWGRIEYPGRPLALGEDVQKGQVLAHVILELSAVERHALLDQTIEVEGVFEEAEARQRQARDDYERALRLAENDSALEREARRREQILDQAIHELTLLQGMVERQAAVLVRRDPNTREVSSPLSGTIAGIHFVPGELNPEGSFRKLFTITDLSEVWVEAQVFERDIPLLRNVRGIEVRVQAHPDRVLPARLQSIGVSVNQTSHLPIWFALDNADRLLRPGMQVEARIALGQAEEVTAVPVGALVSERGDTFVFVATSPDRFERRPVRPGRTVAGLVEIPKGLRLGERIATSGLYHILRAHAGSEPSQDHGHVH